MVYRVSAAWRGSGTGCRVVGTGYRYRVRVLVVGTAPGTGTAWPTVLLSLTTVLLGLTLLYY